MATYRLTGPDGATYNVTAPDSASQDEVLQQFHANMPAATAQQDAPKPKTGYLESVKNNVLSSGQAFNEMLAGAARGAARGGAMMMRPFESAQANAGRIGSINDFLAQELPDNTFPAEVGRTGYQVAQTAGIGPAAAVPLKIAAKVAPALMPLAEAVGSSGMTTGRTATGFAGRAADMGTRMVGGAAVGAGSTAAVGQDPTMGAAIGGFLPPALRVAGVTGQALAQGWRAIAQPRAVNAAEDLAKALGVASPEQRAILIAQLKSAPELLTSPTVAQALQTPEAGILQRVVHDSPGGAPLRDKIAAQQAARVNALEGVAPTAPNGLAAAQEDLGRRMSSRLIPERDAARAASSARYAAVDDPANPVRLELPLDEMAAVRDKYLGSGVVGQGQQTAAVLKHANEIGTETAAPLITKNRQLASTEPTLGAAVRRLGISADELKSGMAGEVRYLRESKFGNGLVNKNGQSLDHIAERMHADGYLDSPDPHELIQKLTEEASGSPVMSRFGNPERMGRDAAMPDTRVSAGTSTPVPLDWKTLQDFRSSVGNEAFKARVAMNDRDAAALGGIKNALSERVDQAAGQGLLKPGENFPADAYARWVEANAAHAAMKGKYDNGLLSGAFRVGKDGEPVLQGAALARRAWGDAENVQAFKKLVADHKDLLGEFKSMVTTEGGSTADAGGNLTIKFARWVDKRLPGLKEAFSPEEVKKLQTIAADIERHASAVKAGTSLGGSNTYQNASNALSLGLLDSPALSAIAGRTPVVGRLGGMALDAVKGHARNAKAERLAELLADAPSAADALARIGPENGLRMERINALVAPSIYRGAPRSDRR